MRNLPRSVSVSRDPALERLLNLILERLRLLTPYGSETIKIRQLAHGLSFDAVIGPNAGISIKPYRWKQNKGDYFIGRTWDGTTEGSTDVNIAKPLKLRNAITQEVLRGTTVNYSAFDLTQQSRLATNPGDGSTETQYITPVYVVNDVIYAAKVWTGVTFQTTPGGPVTTVSLLDVNIDGRAWAAL